MAPGPPPPESEFVARWLEITALRRDRLGARRLDWDHQPPPYKEYPDAGRLSLPAPAPPAGDLWTALHGRRSRREFDPDGVLPVAQLSALLWACQGVTARHGPCRLRTAPSAGALYPFETYVSVQRMAGMAPGLAHLNVPGFHLEALAEGRFGPHLADAALGQGFLADAAVVLIWTAVLPRCAWKYGPRAVRYLGLDLGHVCQNLTLAAEALGLNCCPVAAFCDTEVNALLEVDGADEFAYYLAAVGPPRT